MLAQDKIVPYLIARGLLSTRAIIEGDVTIVDASRHNRNCRVINAGGPSYLVKQGDEATGFGTLAYEASIYRRLLGAGDAHFERYLPRSYGYDPAAHVLILELIREGEDLRHYHAWRHRFPAAFAAQAGEILGDLHAPNWQANGATDLACDPPPVLSIHRPPLSMVQSVSGGNMRLLALVQQVPEVCESLEALRRDWKASTFIHGDVRWDNFIISRDAQGQRRPALRLVDWEFAGLGDPCWDVGSFLSEYLSFWLLSIPGMSHMPAEQLADLAQVPLARLQPAMRTFWQSYRRRLGLNDTAARDRLRRAVRFAAARLLDRACEQMDRSSHLTRAVINLVQVSMNMLQRPQAAAEQLMGIVEAGSSQL